MLTLAQVINGNTINHAPNNSTQVAATKKSHFTPYESPLKLLHSYRFHPQFTKEVSGGYRSVTYSNNIRENDDFCRYELQGGTCNDEKCLDQHFREAGISGAFGVDFFLFLLYLTQHKHLAQDEEGRGKSRNREERGSW